MNNASPAPPVPPTSKSSPLAIWSLVLGILSLTLCSVFAAIPAVICGHMASGRIKRSNGLLTGQGLALAGLITGYISVGLSLILVPALMALVPNLVERRDAYIEAREKALRYACIANLSQLDSAIMTYALDKRKKETDTVTLDDLKPYLRGSLVCPSGGTSISDSYRVTDFQSPPTCITSNGGAAHGHVLPPMR